MLQAGTATVDITPPPGSLMACFPHGPRREPRRARGAHDPLLARVLLLRHGESAVALVACDLCGIRRVDVGRIRARVAGDVPSLAGERIVVACSHSHSSVEDLYLFGNSPEDPFILEMNTRIAKAVVEAWSNLEPVEVAFGSRPVELNHNRRVLDANGRAREAWEYADGVTTGIVDPELAVLKIVTTTSRVKAIVYRYTAHSLTVGPGNLLYTADYPGRARGEVEAVFPGCAALFLNGAAGNVHPRECMRRDFTATEAIGRALGQAVVDVARDASVLSPAPGLRFRSETLTFENRVDSTRKVDVELSCLALGPVLLGFVPGEVFVEFQLQFRRAVAPACGIFVGYANGWPGYVPTLAAYAEGGYGVDLCSTDPAEYSRTALPPGAGELLLEKLVAMARHMIDT
ncbi:MAG: hypothetical protein GXP31_05915 [Kiritimatiellaeota bacterium]|nr:hypothetical protein [Kiritimatiellota bacterium]